MVAGIRSYLAADGLDVVQEVKNGSLVLSSDSGRLVDGVFDPARMLSMLADAVNDALARVHAALSKHGGVYVNETLSRLNPFYSPAGSLEAPPPSAPRLKEMIRQLRLQSDS